MTGPAYTTTILNTITSRFKPHRAEALQRIRFNLLSLVVLFILAALLPFPSLPAALTASLSRRYSEKWDTDRFYRWTCLFEVGLSCIFTLNVLQSVYAIKYPRPEPSTTSGSKGRALNALKSPSQTPQSKKPFTVLSPNSSPQPQKAFSFSPSTSLSSSLGGISLGGINSNNNSTSISGYRASPISTPTRIKQYTSVSTSGTGLASSSSTVGYTPSPSVSAYRGKHLTGSVGRALDGSYLGRIVNNDSDDDDD